MIEKTWDMSPHRRKIFIDMVVYFFDFWEGQVQNLTAVDDEMKNKPED
jgi:hypothetical protein